MKKILLVLATLTLSSCGQTKRALNDLSGDLTPYCYQGVTYLALGRDTIVMAHGADGKPLGCK